MKFNKKIFLALLTPILFFSITSLASADTAYLGFTNNSKTSSVNIAVTYSTQGGTAGAGKFKPGDTLYHTIDVSPNQDIRCANGAGHAQQLYIYGYKFLIGKPNTGYYLNYQSFSNVPELYLQNNYLVTPEGSITLPSQISANDVTFSRPQIPYHIYYLEIFPGSFEDMYVQNGNLYASFRAEGYDSSSGSYVMYDEIKAVILKNEALLSKYSYKDVALNHTPSLTTKDSGRPVNTNSVAYGSDVAAAQSTIKIPTNAESGQYVAQFSLRPSYTNYTPPTNPYTGPWNSSSNSGSNPLPPPSNTPPSNPPTQYKTCPDGSYIPSSQPCPEQTKTCPGGEVVPIGETCPKVLYKTCMDGSRVVETGTCYKTCPDGSSVPETNVCPRVRDLPPKEGDCTDPTKPCQEMLYYIKSFLSTTLQKANAARDQEQMLMMALNGGGSGGGSGVPTPPASCGTSWWCNINFSEVTLSSPFEIVTTNTTPGVQVK